MSKAQLHAELDLRLRRIRRLRLAISKALKLLLAESECVGNVMENDNKAISLLKQALLADSLILGKAAHKRSGGGLPRTDLKRHSA